MKLTGPRESEKHDQHRADVAVVIVSYNTREHIEPCLKSLFEECAGIRQQVIVVDNASTDGSVQMIRDRFPQVTVIESGTNLGFAAAVNLGATHSAAEFLLLLNPDTLIVDQAVARIVAFARTRPGLGLYGGRALRRDGSLEPSSCWALPTLWSLTMFATGMTILAKGNPLLDPESMGGWGRDSVREVGLVTGCFLLVPTAVWRELDGFDERYFMYGEDADLAIRARAAGYRPTICPSAVIMHDVGQSSTRAAKLMMNLTGRATLLRTHWRGVRRQLGLTLIVFGVGLRALVEAIGPALRDKKKSGSWPNVWRERRRWIAGYPLASGRA